MIRAFLIAVAAFLGVATAAGAQETCKRFEGKTYSRAYETVGIAPRDITGFLANPGTELALDRRGVWFPEGTTFIAYPMIGVGTRIMVMSDTGVFAAVQPNAILCPRGEQPALERELVDIEPVYVGRRSRLHSVFQISCNEKLEDSRSRQINWSFEPFNIGTVGVSTERSTTVSFDGTFQKLFFYFHDPVENVTLKVTETQSCVGGSANNDPKWEIQQGAAGGFSITQAMLAQRGITNFDFFTGRPVVSCKAQLDALMRFMNAAPVSDKFLPHLAGLMGEWLDFKDFDVCPASSI